VYEPFVNGTRVGNDHLRPGWTDYAVRIQYQTYDVTALLREGANALGIILGDGWYCGELGWYDLTKKNRNHYGREPRALVQLVVRCGDGSAFTITSDEAWKGRQGPILDSDFLMGETYDARREMPGWCEPGCDERDWRPVWVRSLCNTVRAAGGVASTPLLKEVDGVPARADDSRDTHVVPLEGRPGPSVKIVAEVPAISVRAGVGGTWLFDLGRIINGNVRLRVKGKAGSTVILRFSERLAADGTVYTDHYRRARCIDQYTLKGGGVEIWNPTFTYRTFRYVEASGLASRPSPADVTGLVLASECPPAGAFNCSCDLLNRIHDACAWTIRNNYLDIPSDCNNRDERLGWLADARFPWRTAAYNSDIAAFHTKWLTDVRDALTVEGAYPYFAPRPFHWIESTGNGEGSPVWADSGVLLPWLMYRFYADTAILQQHYDVMSRYISLLHERNADGRWTQLIGVVQAGDWLTTVDVDTARHLAELVATAQLAQATATMARVAGVLGCDEDAQRFTEMRKRSVRAFNEDFVDADGSMKVPVQTACLMALAYDLLPAGKRPTTFARLVRDIEDHGGALTTGLAGTELLPDVLTRFGRPDLVYRLLLREEYPSWGYMIAHVATALWERWNSYTPEAGFASTGMNSFCHPALSSVGQWFYSGVAGIGQSAASAGFSEILLRPRPGGGLTHASASYRSIRGMIRSEWRLEDGTFQWSVGVPPGAAALAVVPASTQSMLREGGTQLDKSDGVSMIERTSDACTLRLESGEYRFEVD
jgi:alpha-L-rhamnosidase